MHKRRYTSRRSPSPDTNKRRKSKNVPPDNPALQQYTVGWVCALQEAYAVACRMLDTEFNCPELTDSHGNNTYTFGCIGDHLIIVGCPPMGQYGTSSAAQVARDMVRSFPNLRFALMVGIGAGVPAVDRDVRLGDVVVGVPQNGLAGFVQYGMAKPQPTGPIHSPPEVVLGVLPEMQRHHDDTRKPDRIAEHFNLVDGLDGYQKPVSDMLYRIDCHCQSGQLLGNEALVQPPGRRKHRTFIVHYGTIASGTTVMKNPIMRDVYATDSELGILCFEREAAGLMRDLPCIVIRGICDYADMHKNGNWHKYAALTAGAYSRELLLNLAAKKVEQMPSWAVVIKDHGSDLPSCNSTQGLQVASAVLCAICGVEDVHRDEQFAKLMAWLSAVHPCTKLNEARRKRYGRTGAWFLRSGMFREWKIGARHHIWVQGMPGCGKTVLASSIVDELKRQGDSPIRTLVYFFDFSNVKTQTVDGMFRSLIMQLCAQDPGSRAILHALYSHCGDGSHQPTTESLFAILQEMIAMSNSRIRVIIDALDECREQQNLISWMRKLLNMKHADSLSILITSRRAYELESGLAEWVSEENYIPMQGNSVDADIREFIRGTLHEDSLFQKRWRAQPYVFAEIERALMKKANGMFQWVSCQLNILKECIHLRQLRQALNSLPATLNEVYSRILKDIKEEHVQDILRVLQFLAYSVRPLTLHEAVDALAVDPYEPSFNAELRIPCPEDIIKLCPSMMTLFQRADDGNKVIGLHLSHLSVKEYLLSDSVEDVFKEGMKQAVAHTSISRVCLAYLKHLGPTIDGTDEIEHNFPLVRYSAYFWANHARHAQARQSSDDVLDLMCQQKYSRIWDYITRREMPQDKGALQPLYYACSHGLDQAALKLIESGADVNAECGYFGTGLQVACLKGHVDMVQMLLQCGADINANSGPIGPPLHLACRGGNEHIVKLLLEHGADIEAEGALYGGALQAASYAGNAAIVHLLLQHGADIDAELGHYGSALQTASYVGNDEVVHLLLESGAAVHAKSDPGEYEDALYCACKSDDEKIAEVFLENGADILVEGDKHEGGSHPASLYEHEKAVQMFLAYGPDDASREVESCAYGSEANDTSHEPPVFNTSYGANEAVVRTLLEHGADPNREGPNATTALWVVALNGSVRIAEILLKHGADPNLLISSGETALHSCCREGNLEMARLLLKYGGDVNLQGDLYGNALGAASASGNEELVKFLISEGADINDGALRAAAESGHEGLVEYILCQGAQLNKSAALEAAARTGNDGLVRMLLGKGAGTDNNALKAAAESGHDSIIRLLLQHGADVNQKGKSALQIASAQGHLRAVQTLLEAGANIRTGALSAAVGHGHKEQAILLLSAGADVNGDPCDGGSTPLQHASFAQDVGLVRLLLAHGADMNMGCFSSEMEALTSMMAQYVLEVDNDPYLLSPFESVWSHKKRIEILLQRDSQANADTPPKNEIPQVQVRMPPNDERCSDHDMLSDFEDHVA